MEIIRKEFRLPVSGASRKVKAGASSTSEPTEQFRGSIKKADNLLSITGARRKVPLIKVKQQF